MSEIYSGQDSSTDVRRKPRPEPVRSTKAVTLRLQPQARQRLYRQAAVQGMTLTAYVAELLREAEYRSTPLDDRDKSARPSLEQTSRLAHSIHALLAEVRASRNELARQGGLLKLLVYERKIARDDPATQLALAEVTEATLKADAAIATLLQETAEMREQLRQFALTLTRR
jgi:hypothetical protein